MIARKLVLPHEAEHSVEPERRGLSVSQWWLCAALCALAFAFLFFTRAVELSGNSVGYAEDAERGVWYAPHLMHSHYIAYLRAALSGLGVDTIAAGQLVSLLWAIVSLFSVGCVLKRLTGSFAVAVTGAGLLLVSHGFWVFSSQLEVYIPLIGSLTALSAALLGLRPGAARVLLCSLFWFIAVTYHTTNVLFLAPLAFLLLTRDGLRGLLELVLVCALAGSASLVLFLGVFLTTEPAPHTLDSFLTWALHILDVPMTDWGSVANLGYRGIGRGVESEVAAALALPDPAYLRWHKHAGELIFAGIFAWNGWQVLRLGPLWRERVYLFLWLAAFFLFFAWWSPGVYKFFVPSLVPILLLGGLALRELWERVPAPAFRAALAGGCALLALGMTAVNWRYSVGLLRGDEGPDYAEAVVIQKLAPANCTITSIGHHAADLSYFFQRRALATRDVYERFYGELTRGTPDRLTEQECSFVRLGYLSPTYYEYLTLSMLKASWGDFIAWFLDVREDGSGITHHPFRVVREEGGPPHLIVERRQRVAAPSRDAVIGQLAELCNAAQQTYGNEWWRVGNASTRGFRDRSALFGYASGDRYDGRADE